jgi:hypothetical protein
VASTDKHRERRHKAYERAAQTHERASATELHAADFFKKLADAGADQRHREASDRQAQLAKDDHAEAATLSGERRRPPVRQYLERVPAKPL